MTLLPIVDRELRVSARKRATYWLRPLAAAAAMLIFFCAVLGPANNSAGELSKQIFRVSCVMALGGCLLAGLFLTSDCLSSEKRDGTLGLLFLTDLRSLDVVLGKLVSSSLAAFYGLLSILPVLALPLLMGGVTGGEFWRMVLVLLAALLFSLSVGMLASTVSRDARQAFGLTIFAIITTTCVLPAVYAMLKTLDPGAVPSVHTLLWPGLGYACRESAAEVYGYRANRGEFWGSLSTVVGISLVCLGLACLVLPRVWQVRPEKSSPPRNFGRRIRFGAAASRQALRTRLLRVNPFYWLGLRDRLPRLVMAVLMAVGLPIWMGFFGATLLHLSTPGNTFELLLFATFGVSLAAKFLMASEASRRFCEDRQSGSLELLLSTPLTEREMIAGHRNALWRQFWPVLATISVMYGLDLWLLLTVNSLTFRDPVFVPMMTGNIVVLFSDFFAMTWLGTWTGLQARQHPRAILATVSRILFIPWLGYLLLGFSGIADALGATGFFSCWFIFGLANDLVWARLSRNRLYSEFRTTVAGLDRVPRGLRMPPAQFTA